MQIFLNFLIFQSRFFSPCTYNRGATSSVVGDQECNQFETTNSPFGGTEMSASNSYQLNFGSLPFGAPGKLRGLTMKKLFKKIFSIQPKHVFISSWNEFIAQPQPNPYQSVNTGFSKGLPFDPDRNNLWVDSYGSEFLRDIEPTLEYGDYYYQLLKSCLRVYKSGATACTNTSEECCNMGYSNVYVNVYSLVTKSASDYLLTADKNEFNILIHSGAWKEICTPFPGPSEFCVDKSLKEGQSSSFIIFSQQLEPTDVALYRCITSDKKHFFSLDANCEGTKTESRLGYISTYRSGNSIRGLYRCYNRAVHYHSLDIPCPQQDTDTGLLGYVR